MRALGLKPLHESVLAALLSLQSQDPGRAEERRGWTAQEVSKAADGSIGMTFGTNSAAAILVLLQRKGLIESVQSAAMPRVQWFATLPDS